MSRRRTSPARGSEGTTGPLAALLERVRPRRTIEEEVRRVLAPHLARRESGIGRVLVQRWRRTVRLLSPLGGVSSGNAIEVFDDGDVVFERMWSAIAAARSEVHLTTYVFAPDRVGRRTLDELTAAAERGCAVTLIFDAFGSHRLVEADLAPLRLAGARVVAYNPVVRFAGPLSRLVRNHQKILVVDGEVGFCGGMNVTEDYAGARFGNGRFRDSHVCVRGPCVADLRAIASDALEAVSNVAHDSGQEGALVQVLESNVRRNQRAIQRALRTTIERAVERCYLTSPYFVPPRRLSRDLQHASKRGVDVRVLTAASNSDVRAVYWASQHLYGRLLRAGVRIYELESRTLHAKTATIDGVYASVGSFNLDYWSYRRNLEVTLSALDSDMADKVEAHFLSDLEGAREVTLESWGRRTIWQRALHWLAYQILRL